MKPGHARCWKFYLTQKGNVSRTNTHQEKHCASTEKKTRKNVKRRITRLRTNILFRDMPEEKMVEICNIEDHKTRKQEKDKWIAANVKITVKPAPQVSQPQTSGAAATYPSANMQVRV